MAALNRFMKVILPAIFRGKSFREESMAPAASSLEIARATGNVVVSVVVGVIILVLGVGLLGYALISFSSQEESYTVPIFKAEEPTVATELPTSTSKDATLQDAPSLASEPEESAPKLRRSARIREKTALAAKKMK